MFLFVIVLVASIVAFLLHWKLSSKKRKKSDIVELALLYQLIFNIGILGFFSFYGLTFLPETTASYIRWPISPFQQELGNVNLAFGVLGILCIWYRGLFWNATIIGASIWLFADGLGHLIDALAFGNMSDGNTGPLVYSDLLIPVILVGLLISLRLLREKKK